MESPKIPPPEAETQIDKTPYAERQEKPGRAKPKILQRRMDRRGFFGLAAKVGLMATLAADAPASAPPLHNEKPPEPEPLPPGERPPYEPTAEEIAAVEALFDQPGRPEIDTTDKSSEEIAAENARIDAEAAAKNGLTVHDWRAVSADLQKDLRKEGGPEIPFSTYMERAQEFLGRYGITFSNADAQHPNVFNGDVLTSADLENKACKNALTALIIQVGEFPVELIQELGMKKITMIKIGSPKIAGYTDPQTGTEYFFDPRKPLGSTFRHELYHGYEITHWGPTAYRRDAAFEALNPQKIYDTDRPATALSLETYSKQTAEGTLDYRDPNIAAQVVTPTEYSFDAPIEDKAEIGEMLTSSLGISRVLDRKHPVLRNKALLLLARWYHDKPAVVNYLAQVRREI